MELVDGLDVGEYGGDCLWWEECAAPVLLVHAEVENLPKKTQNISLTFLRMHRISGRIIRTF
jgi:hypothetical protein